MFCENCGRKIEEGIKFCPGCGTQVGAAGVSTNQEKAANIIQPQPKDFSLKGKYGWVLMLCALGLGFLIGIFVGMYTMVYQ
jgi:uncharacterized membrane protein YvbJ